MESLLSVKIERDECQCCFRTFKSTITYKSPITTELQSVFFDLMNERLNDGMICNKCSEHLNIFQNFKLEILSIRKQFREDNCEAKQEPDGDYSCNETCYDEEVIDEQFSVIEYLQSENLVDKKLNLTQILEAKLEVKVEDESKKSQCKETHKKFKPKLLDEDEKQTKSLRAHCPVEHCSKILTVRSLPAHIKTHDINRERNFMCEICSKTYLNKHELVVHRRKHLNIRPYVCDIDNKSFTSKNNLAKHIQSQHLNIRRSVEFKILCPVCEKLFPYHSKMVEHFRKAHPGGHDDGLKVNPATNHFHCDKCGCEFLTKYRIDSHVCIVGSRSSAAENLCPVCTVQCQNRLQLIKHFQDHGKKLENNKWRCKICDAIVQDKIAIHVENTHSTGFISCSLCRKQLKNRKSLRQHVFLSHQNGYEIRKKRKLERDSFE